MSKSYFEKSQIIEGLRIRFRLADTTDAPYIYILRANPKYNRHLSAPPESVQKQKVWLESYNRREANGKEYYFIIENLDRRPCGTMRVYNITHSCATWGSFILDQSKPPKAALDALLLIHETLFLMLQVERAFFDVRRDNARALRLYQTLNAREIDRDDQNIYFEVPASRYETLANTIQPLIERE